MDDLFTNIIYIGENGNDANTGSIVKPFKTIVFARDYI